MCKLRPGNTALVAVLLRFFLALALALISAVPASGYEDVSVSVQPMIGALPRHGYREIKVYIGNRSSKLTRVVRLQAPAEISNAYYDQYIRGLTRTVTVEPGAEVSVSLLQPSVPLGGSELGVIVEGEQPNETRQLDAGLSQARNYYKFTPCVLVSRALKTEAMQDRAEKLLAGSAGQSSGSYSYGEPEITFIRSELTCDLWSGNWLAYSGYDGIIMSAEDMAKLPAAAKQALWRYVTCGGVLAVAGGTALPQAWRGAPSRVANLDINYAGFGCVVPLPADGAASISNLQLAGLIDLFKDTLRPYDSGVYYGRTDPNTRFPVTESLRIPVKGLTLLMLVFVLTVGPANMFVLSRANRRLWLLWTMPVLSLITCVMVWLYASFAEGWKAYSRIETVTVLDETANEAATIAMAGYYSPLTPRGGLRFDYDTEITQLNDSRYRGGVGCTIDENECQHLASGWMAARIPSHFQLRKCESRRERLVVRKDEKTGGLSMVNGLGADIVTVHYMDEAGQLYTAADVNAGAKSALSAVPKRESASDRALLRTLYATDWTSAVQMASVAAPYTLKPNQYIAEMKTSPFIEPGLAGATPRKHRAIVFGVKGGLDGS